MRPDINIRKLLAAGLLLLFTFSITPKLFWHDLVTGHRHQARKKTTTIAFVHDSRKSFNCSWDETRLESPFSPGLCYEPEQQWPVVTCYNQYDIPGFVFGESRVLSLRAPPAA